jgi:NADPH:quinone reductase-like Zn-dependent oxidoreductase
MRSQGLSRRAGWIAIPEKSATLRPSWIICLYKMKAMRVNNSTPGPALAGSELPRPQPGEGELLISVRAAGVTPTELSWYPTTHTKEGTPRKGAVPGHEFSGVIAALGRNANGFEVGQEIYGLNDWFADGATAEVCLTTPQSIAGKPASLTHEAAATVPIGALTAWQGLLERAKIKPGERVLIHGASGAVGIFAVQLAHRHGAYVIGTASSANLEFVGKLGADEVIDYRLARFEDRTEKVDVVFDGVGGETLARSWSMLKPGGRMVTIVDEASKDAFFIVEPNQKQLVEVAKLLDAGELKTYVGAVVPLAEASNAYSGAVPNKRQNGKVVIVINEQT